jgi:glycosyltransferase involved in cell wall biosynthesis
MRIVLVVPGAGGICRDGYPLTIAVIQALMERLARRHEVLVVPLDEEQRRRYQQSGARVATLGCIGYPGRAVRWIVGAWRLISILREFGGRFDVIHAFWAGRPATLALAAGGFFRIPVVASIGGGELVWLPDIGYGGQGSWLMRIKNRLVLQMAEAVTAPSRYALTRLAALRPDAIWLPTGPDRRSFDGPAARAVGPPWRLLNVATINRVKDHATLLRATRIVLEQGIPVQLDCIGEDTLGGSVQRMASAMGLTAAVNFHGFKPLEEILPFYRQAHLYVQSSLHESMGAAVLEAAAAGLPTVGTAVGIVGEMAPLAARAVPVRDPEALAKGILSLLADQPERERLAHAAQEYSTTYDADWTANRFEALYTSLDRRHRTSSKSAAGGN